VIKGIMMIKSREFSLVLSGGGALGIAHLGVLSDLERANIKPSEIVGTSMGGIIGACYSIGLSEKEIYSHIESFIPP
jgi:NTE family protein